MPTLVCSPPITLVVHGGSDLLESSNVGARDQRRQFTFGWSSILLGGIKAVVEAGNHDVLQLGVNLFGSPAEALGVLGHFETRDGDTTAVGSFACGIY
jgi:hypothetical protein